MAKQKVKPHPDQMNLPGVDPDLQQKLDFAKAPSTNGAKKKKETKEGPPNLAKAVKVSVPDFSDPNRPKTCLEVDFPIVPINELSALEGNAGKPIYQMSKWWARRRSSVFRAMLIAAAMEAPSKKDDAGNVICDENGVPVPDLDEAASAVWGVYYANHQKAENFKDLKVLDCFMGGGTTLVEGSRLGFQVAGVDLNPVAWFVVKNELACTDPKEVAEFFDQIEADVKPVIQPFYVADCPRGHQGTWFKLADTDEPNDDERMPADFDPTELKPEERKAYRYEGPEVIYTFWAKHGQCSKRGCGHRTPVFKSPVIAEKKLGVKYIPLTCKSCKTRFHAELGAARMAPAAERIVLESEGKFTELSQPFAQRLLDYAKGKKEDKQLRVEELFDMVDDEPGLCCPECGEYSGQFLRDVFQMHKRATRVSDINKKHLKIEPSRNSMKPVFCYLLVDPEWLKGSPGFINEEELGGHADASVEDTQRWYEERLKKLRLIEVRGQVEVVDETASGDDESAADSDEGEEESKGFGLPRFITLSDGRQIDTQKGTIPKKSHFTCGKCGSAQKLNESTEASGHAAAAAIYAVQGFCPECESEARIYKGRSFAAFGSDDCERLVSAEREWHDRRDGDLKDYWPREEIPRTYMTHHANFALPRQGFTHWWKLFHTRQLIVHASILASIMAELRREHTPNSESPLIAFQQHLRYA